MADPYLGQILMFGGNYAPIGYAFCNGQFLPTQQYAALFALLGTTYGGNGVNVFRLPDLQSRLPVGFGQGIGLSHYNLGETGGGAVVALLENQIPTHTHALMASTGNANAANISNTVVPAKPPASGAYFYATEGTPPLNLFALNAGALGPAGENRPHNNLMPSLCITFCIAMIGKYPTPPRHR
jgi:microcystin-dependent protein